MECEVLAIHLDSHGGDDPGEVGTLSSSLGGDSAGVHPIKPSKTVQIECVVIFEDTTLGFDRFREQIGCAHDLDEVPEFFRGFFRGGNSALDFFEDDFAIAPPQTEDGNVE